MNERTSTYGSRPSPPRRRSSCRARGLACLAAAFAASCTGQVEPAGSVRLAVSEVSADTVVATIRGRDDEAFEPIVAPFSRSGTIWSASVSQVPAGPGRRFDVTAHDADGEVRYVGSATVDVPPGHTLSVTLILQAWQPPPQLTSWAPVLHAITASPGTVAPDGAARLEVIASDPGGGELRYAWWGSCGSFAEPDLPATSWTAPSQDGRCEISIGVTGQNGHSTSVYLPMYVQATAP